MKKTYAVLAVAIIAIFGVGVALAHNASKKGAALQTASVANGALPAATTSPLSSSSAPALSASASESSGTRMPTQSNNLSNAQAKTTPSHQAAQPAVSASANESASAAVTSPNGWYYVFVAPDDYFKTPGSQVVFYGSHFYPGETVSITYGSAALASVQADASGTFISPAIAVPYGVTKAVYAFKGDASGIPFRVSITVGPRNPWIDLSAYYVQTGTQVAISGHQFGSNESVTIAVDGTDVGMAQTSANGDFETAIQIPAGSGKRTISARGAFTGTAASQKFSQAR